MSHGKTRQSAGASGENLVELHHENARLLKLAYVFKRPTPFRVISSLGGGRLVCQKTESAGVDYSGVLCDGRAVFVEAKHHQGAGFALDNILPAQLLEMRQIARVCPAAIRVLAIAWVPTNPVVRELKLIPGVEYLCAIPWDLVEKAVESSAKSLPRETLLGHLVDRSKKSYLELFLRGE